MQRKTFTYPVIKITLIHIHCLFKPADKVLMINTSWFNVLMTCIIILLISYLYVFIIGKLFLFLGHLKH